jgi:hypothetical protein
MNRGALTDPSFIGSSKRSPIKKEANLKNAKGLIQKTSDKKRGNLEKCNGAYSKTSNEKVTTLKNTNGLI